MLVNKKIRSGDKKVDEYIERLEKLYEFSNLYRFIMAANEIAGVMADDMSKIAKGNKTGLKLLSNDKDDKLIDRLSNVLKQVDNIKKIQTEADALVSSGKVEDPNKIEIKSDTPAVEQLMSRAKNGF